MKTQNESVMAKKVFQEDSSINSLDDIVFGYRKGLWVYQKRNKRHLLSGFLIFGGAVAYPLIEAYSLKL